ncbi:MAG: hypothetical protein MHPSP_004869, partial [Paramarteilia canceri]
NKRSLPLLEKSEIVKLSSIYKIYTQQQLEDHFSTRFKIYLSRRTICDILKNKLMYLEAECVKTKLINYDQKYPNLENALFTWLCIA